MTKHLNLLLFLTLSLLLGNYAQADNQTSAVVTVSGGQIQGTVQDGVSIYKGIPFAAPPLGDLRWKDPQPVQSWSGVLDHEQLQACADATPVGEN
jgi:para-nitrobenzyl esterase